MLNKIALAILTLFLFASDVFAATVIDLDGRYSISVSKSSKLDTRYTFYEKNKATNSTTSRTLSSNVWSRNISVTGNYSYSYKVCYTKYENEEDRTICGSSKAYANEYLVVLTPSSINVPSVDANGSFTVSWVAPGATSYQLQQRKGSGSWVTIHTGAAASKDVSGLTNGTYSYRVSAFYNSTQGGYKTSGNVTVLLPPATPSNLNASASIDGNVTLDWSAISGATNYTLQERVGSGSWSTLSTSITATNTLLNRGAGSYRYRVAACEGQNCSDYRESSGVSVSPSAPGTVTSLSGSYTVTAPSGDPLIDKYKFEETNVATDAKVKKEENDNRWSRNITSTGLYSYTYQSCKSELGDNGEDSSVCHSRKSISTSYLVVLTPSSINVPSVDANGSFTVSWVAPGATSYQLQQRKGSGSWVTIHTGAAASKDVSGLTNGTYSYRVSAFYNSTQGGYKTSGNVTVLLPPATPSNVSVPTSTVTNGSIAISWPAVSTATKYTLQESKNNSAWVTVASAHTGTSYTRAGRANGSYKYQVRAYNASGWGGYKVSSAVTVLLPPATPSNVSVPTSTVTNGSIAISWPAVSTATKYTLQESKDNSAWVTVASAHTGTSYTRAGRANGSYKYQVRAYNASGWGGYKVSSAVTVLLPPATPSNLNASASIDGNVTLDWSAISSATNYTLQERVGSGSWSTLSTSITATNTLLNRGAGSYRYRVAACEGQNCSDYRESSGVSVSPPAPGTVTSLSGSYTVTAPSGDPLIDKYKFEETNVATDAKVKKEENDNRWSRNITSTGLYSYTYQSCKSELGDNGEDSSVCHSRKSISTSYLVVLTPSSINVPSVDANGSFTVSWVAPGATSYQLQQRKGSGSWVTIHTGAAASKDVSGLTNGTYSYRVSAFYNSTQGGYKTSGNVTVLLPPATPSNVSVPTSTVTNGSIAISWPAVSTATKYTLQESKNNSAWVTVASAHTGTSYTRAGRANGSYKYQVRAYNASGWGGYKVSSAVTVLLPPATPSNVSVPTSTVTNGSIAISWPAVSTATKYTLQESKDNSAWVTVASAHTGTSYTRAGRANGSYKYQVRAYNASGWGGYKVSSAVTVLLLPATPSNVSVPTSTVTNGSIAISWPAVSTATKYTLQESKNNSAWVTVASAHTGTSYTRAGRANGSYKYQVRAYNASGWGGYKVSSAVTVLLPPATPSNVSVPTSTVTNGSIAISWPAVSTATKYTLQESKNNSAWVTVASAHTGTSYTRAGRANGSYKYQVRAYNASGWGGYKVSSAVTVLLPPATPSNLNASASIDGNVTLDWSAISGATNYTLQERVGSGSWSTLSTSITATNTLLNRGAGSYRYRVAACEGQNCSDYRESSGVSVSPSAPGTVTSLSGSYTVTAPSGDPLIDKYKFEETNVATGAKVKREENDNRWSRNITSTGLYSYTYQSCKSELGDNGEDSSVCHSRKSISTSYLVVLTPSSINVPATSYNGNVNVSWVAAGATSYLLEYQKNGTGDWVDAYKDSATQATVSNLTDGDYVFRVSAFYDTTQGNYKAASIVTKVSLTPGAASAITVPTSTVTDRTFPISWPIVSNAKTYTLQEGRLSGDGQYSLGWATIDENISAKNSTDSEITYHHKAPKGGLYKYQVKACNAICSDYTISNRVSVVEPPLSIGNLTLTQPIENKNSLIVSWDTVDKATFYNVEMNVDKTDWQPAKLELDTTSHTVAIESVNASYQFRVSACNVAGCSEFTLSPILPILFAPKAPEMISVPDSLVTNGQLEVRWAASVEATHYILEEKLDDNIWSPPPSDEFLKFTELTDIKITRSNLPDGEYTYRVAACKELFCSDFVTSDVVTLVTAPSPPDSVSVENTQLGKLNIFWDEVAEATSYKLEWSVDNGEWTILGENIEETTLEHAIKLSGNYQFRVASCNELCGNYTYSPNIEYRDPFSYVDGLIPHGDFESGNDFSGRNSNVVTSFETVSPIAGDRSLKVNANGWDYIFYKAKNFTESNGFISNAQLTGFIKSSRQLRITVRVSYVGGTWSDSSSNSQVIGDFNEVVPISVAVETDTSRQVSLISLYIASGCGTCENPAEFIVDNIQLQTVESSKSIYQDEAGNLYFKLPESHGSKLIKLIALASGEWQIVEITQEEWDALTLTISDFKLDFGEFSSDELEDIRVLDSNEKVLVTLIQTEGGYSISVPTDWITFGGNSVDDTRVTDITAPTSDFYGAVKGNASVNGGAASYSIPMTLPPGRNKVQPSVSLNYSSRSGNGIVGVGWGLSAGGAISRCAQTLAQDGGNAAGKGVSYNEVDDRLCLNGQRLIVTSGVYGHVNATYATEIDSFLSVTQNDGGINDNTTWFEVTYANGTKQHYGENSTEQVIPSGAPATLTWLINREEDFSGHNHMSYSYSDYGDGEVLLNEIAYTGDGTTDGNRKVSFDYEDRTTSGTGKYSTSYLAGGKTRQTKRLKYISTYIDTDTIIRRYELTYKASIGSGRVLLDSVEECAYQGDDVCREKTVLDWSDAELTYITEALTTESGLYLHESAGSLLDNIAEIVPRGDIDGNGSLDWQQHFINAEGESLGVNSFDYESCTYNYLTTSHMCSAADFNQDGLADSWRNNNGVLQIGLTIKNAASGAVTTNWSSPGNTAISLASTVTTKKGVLQIADYNNDGWPDILVKDEIYRTVPEPGWEGLIKLYVHTMNIHNPYSEGQTVGSFNKYRSTTPIGDINGDGILDFSVNKIIKKDYETMPTMSQIKLLNFDAYKNLSIVSHDIGLEDNSDYDYENFSTLIDVNGDGLSDWLGWVPGEANKLHVRLNKGNGTFEVAQSVGFYLPKRDLVTPGELSSEGYYEPISAYSPKFLGAFKHMDVDGDGTTELIMPGNSSDDMLVEACTMHNNYTGGKYVPTRYCGSEIYSLTTQRLAGRSAPDHIKSHNDASIYKYKALKFTERSDGSISASLIDTDLVGNAYNSAVVDAFGNGLSDLVFTYGCSKNFSCSINADNATGVMSGLAKDQVYFSRNYGATEHSSPTKDQYQPVDMLNSVDNGIGRISRWQYRPLSSDTVDNFYQRDVGSADSQHFYFASSMYAVSAFSQSNGVGSGVNTVNYQYDSAMYNIKGRGFRGFQQITETDVTSRRVVVTEFEQLFPFSSLVKRQTITEVGTSTPYSVTTNNWLLNSAHQSENDNNGLYHFYNSQSRTITCELSAISCAWESDLSNNLSQSETIVEADGVDEYGNITQRTATVEDMYGKNTSVTNAVYETSDAWPHKLTSSTVTKSAMHAADRPSTTSDNAAIDTNTSKTVTTHIQSYDSVHRKPTNVYVSAGTSVLSSCAGNLTCSHTLTTYNNYGLPSAITQNAEILEGANQTQVNQARTTNITYSHGTSAAATGYFPFEVSKTVGSYTHKTTTHVNPATGQAIQSTGISGVTSNTSFDALARPIQISSAGYPNQYIAYKKSDDDSPNNAVMLVETTQAGAPTSASYNDLNGQTLRTRTQGFAGGKIFTDTIYDALGQKTRESTPYTTTASFTEYSYLNANEEQDALGRLQSKATPTVNGMLNTAYSYNGLTTTIAVTPTVGASLNMTRTYNSLKQLVSTVDANTNKTSYVYDGAGNPIVIQDVADNSIYAMYDDLGRKQWVDDPNQGKTLFAYNGFSELEREIDANNETIKYDMDTAGRVTNRYSPDGNASFIWDTATVGLLTSNSEGSVSKAFTYDAKARPKTSTTTIDGVAYTTSTSYDANFGRPTLMSYPNQLSIAYQYNDRGYLTAEVNAASGYVYRRVTEQDIWGNITAANIAGADNSDFKITASYSFSNISGQMLNANATGTILGSSGQIQTISYTDFDSYGNLKGQSRTDNGVNSSASYTYDDLHRLLSTNRNVSGSALSIEYGYDAAGNFTKKSDFSTTADNAYNYVAGSNKLSNVSLRGGGSESYGYDNKGNLTHRNNTLESSYNVFNKPLTINRNGATMAFTYGADLARYKQVRNEGGVAITTHYIDKHYEVELEGTKKHWKAYISDVAIVSDTENTVGNKKIRFTLRDRLGSAVTFADHNGVTTARRYFDPFGKPLGGDWSDLTALTGASTLTNNVYDSDMPTRRGFTDHEHLDKAELIHMNGRVYDYNLGRFLSVDPFIQDPGNSQSLNPYSYIMNNPLSGTDPTGYTSEPELEKVEYTKETKKVATTGSHIKREVTTSVSGTATYSNGATQSFSAKYDNGQLASADIGSMKQIAKSANKPQVQKSPNATPFDLQKGQFGKAPDTVNLSQLNDDFSEAWDNSFPNGSSLEQGGTIVSIGKQLALINKNGGGNSTSGTFDPDLNVRSSMRILGVFHTHPYDASEGGYTGISLSGGDAAYMIRQGHNVIIAQSGKKQFMFMRTRSTKTKSDLSGLNNAQNNRMSTLMGQGKSFSQASREAAKETAYRYGLAYYEGTKGVFKRVK